MVGTKQETSHELASFRGVPALSHIVLHEAAKSWYDTAVLDYLNPILEFLMPF